MIRQPFTRLPRFALALLLATSARFAGAQAPAPARQAEQRWTAPAAEAWQAKHGWLVGSNYLPAYAANQLEMWQDDTFDPKRIDLELGWAEGLGMNTMRVFLHDLLWQQDSEGFKKRIDTFLAICARHHIQPLLVLFDSVWDPAPHLGKQPAPRPGVHNSRWVQSPGADALKDPAQYARLEQYVEGVIGAFSSDGRVLGWDLWNEPDNTNASSYGQQEPANKTDLVLALLPRVFEWAHTAHPAQPLTSGIWHENAATPQTLSPMAQVQLSRSDVISFHNYDKPDQFEQEIKWLATYGRPLICTEYMARPQGSTFETIMPIAKQFNVGVINWGFVAGRSQTFLPWDSWQRPYVDRQPAVWFHDIFQQDGTPYRPAEVAFIRKLTSRASAAGK